MSNKRFKIGHSSQSVDFFPGLLRSSQQIVLYWKDFLHHHLKALRKVSIASNLILMLINYPLSFISFKLPFLLAFQITIVFATIRVLKEN